jgi:hypothetical protein
MLFNLHLPAVSHAIFQIASLAYLACRKLAVLHNDINKYLLYTLK